jgi:hypothetical protein
LPIVGTPNDIIRAEGAIIRQSSASKHFNEKLYCGFGRRQRTPLFEAAGGSRLGNLHQKGTIKAGSTLA